MPAPSTNTTTATSACLQIPDLLELILLRLDSPTTLLRAQRISLAFLIAITTSRALQRRLCLAPASLPQILDAGTSDGEILPALDADDKVVLHAQFRPEQVVRLNPFLARKACGLKARQTLETLGLPLSRSLPGDGRYGGAFSSSSSPSSAESMFLMQPMPAVVRVRVQLSWQRAGDGSAAPPDTVVKVLVPGWEGGRPRTVGEVMAWTEADVLQRYGRGVSWVDGAAVWLVGGRSRLSGWRGGGSRVL